MDEWRKSAERRDGDGDDIAREEKTHVLPGSQISLVLARLVLVLRALQVLAGSQISLLAEPHVAEPQVLACVGARIWRQTVSNASLCRDSIRPS